MSKQQRVTNEQLAIEALRMFPLPDQSMASVHNYNRILSWLYSGIGPHYVNIAALIVDLAQTKKTEVKI